MISKTLQTERFGGTNDLFRKLPVRFSALPIVASIQTESAGNAVWSSGSGLCLVL